jgi:hypothetical protein
MAASRGPPLPGWMAPDTSCSSSATAPASQDRSRGGSGRAERPDGGEFYLRELPPLRAVLDDLSGMAGLLVVDGYTDLDPGGRPGLAVPPARTAPRPPPRTRP